MYSGVVDGVVNGKGFESSDFLQQQNQPLADEDDVAEVIRAYANRLAGKNDRRKYNSNKAIIFFLKIEQNIISLVMQRPERLS